MSAVGRATRVDRRLAAPAAANPVSRLFVMSCASRAARTRRPRPRCRARELRRRRASRSASSASSAVRRARRDDGDAGWSSHASAGSQRPNATGLAGVSRRAIAGDVVAAVASGTAAAASPPTRRDETAWVGASGTSAGRFFASSLRSTGTTSPPRMSSCSSTVFSGRPA